MTALTEQELFVLKEMARDYRTSWFTSRVSFHRSRRDIKIPLECAEFDALMRSIDEKAPGLLCTYDKVNDCRMGHQIWRIDRGWLLNYFTVRRHVVSVEVHCEQTQASKSTMPLPLPCWTDGGRVLPDALQVHRLRWLAVLSPTESRACLRGGWVSRFERQTKRGSTTVNDILGVARKEIDDFTARCVAQLRSDAMAGHRYCKIDATGVSPSVIAAVAEAFYAKGWKLVSYYCQDQIRYIVIGGLPFGGLPFGGLPCQKN